MTIILVGDTCTRVPTCFLSVYCPMFVQFGIRDLNVMLLAFPPSFVTIGDEKVQFSYKCQQNYTQRTYRKIQLYAKSKEHLGKRHGTHH